MGAWKNKPPKMGRSLTSQSREKKRKERVLSAAKIYNNKGIKAKGFKLSKEVPIAVHMADHLALSTALPKFHFGRPILESFIQHELPEVFRLRVTFHVK
jgi:hypothetical protein